MLSLLTGLVVIGCGLALAGSPRTGLVGSLVLGAGVSWFLPDLAVTGVGVVDTVLLDTSLLHVALMVHAALVTGPARPLPRQARHASNQTRRGVPGALPESWLTVVLGPPGWRPRDP